MKTNYYISSGFFKRGVPFWILPLVLFILLTVVLSWTLFTTQHTSSSKVFQSIQNSINQQTGNIKERYSLALTHFKNGAYYSSAEQFKSLYYQKNIPIEIRQKSALYYAFSLLLEGIKNGNTHLVEKSRDVFEELMRDIPNTSRYYSRVLLGYAKSTRYSGLGYVVGIDAALRQLANITTSESLKRQIYLELGYYYFSANNYPESNSYFSRAGLYIDSNNFYEVLLSREETAPFMLSLLKNNLIPQKMLSSYGLQIKQQLLKSAMKLTNVGNHISAKNILSTLVNIFPLDFSSEDSYFLMGYIAQKEQNYRQALQYYTRVVSNGYLDKDPIALFQMALISYRLRDVQASASYFNILVQKFPYSYYANEAQKWLEYFYPRKSHVVIPTTPPVSLDENSPSYIFHQAPNAQYMVPSYVDSNTSANKNSVNTEKTPEKPVVNVNIDQSRSFVSHKQYDSNNTDTNTFLEKNDGSGNTVVQQRYPNNQYTTNMNTTSSHDLSPQKNVPPKQEQPKAEPTQKVQKEKELEQTPTKEEQPIKQETPQKTPDEDLAKDFEDLDEDFVDRRPKFKSLF